MCGIAGIYHYGAPDRPVDVDLLHAMTASVAHRGPDGQGLWHAPGIGLGHRRLAILDLSESGRQPMVDPAAGVAVTYNGEIYNFRELRRLLEQKGHRFTSTSDTEVLLAGYREWGPDVVRRISGIFAFAIWDARRRELFLARDPIGVKPLFYADHAGMLRFGSEVKAILTDPAVDRAPDYEALDAFMTFSYTPAPATGFARVRQLLPGQCATYTPGGGRLWSYWEPPYDERPATLDFRTAVEEFTRLFDRVTAAQMVSDVPVGAFLSGGLDSAAVVRAMRRAGCGPVHTLTVGFDVPGFDERDAARQAAERLGVEWQAQEVSVDAAALLPALSRHMEEPTADSSMLPVYLLCREARRRFTVAMSGDGADEILAGYETYRATRLASYYRMLPAALRRHVLTPLARLIPPSDTKYSTHLVANRFVDGAELGPGRDHCSWRTIFNDRLKRRLYSEAFLRAAAGSDPVGAYARHVADVPAEREWLAGLLHADTAFYLPNDMLVKVDRMSMASGLEVRVPFLDVEVVRFCASLPGDLKLHRGKIRKHLLRASLRDTLSEAALNRPKSGFNVPLGTWMRSSLRELLFDAARTHRSDLGELLKLDEVERLAGEHGERRADHGHALFTVLMLALWLDNAAHAWKPPPERVDRDRDTVPAVGRHDPGRNAVRRA
jgi:asparagine synthase (glutamine-hydrolysing)